MNEQIGLCSKVVACNIHRAKNNVIGAFPLRDQWSYSSKVVVCATCSTILLFVIWVLEIPLLYHARDVIYQWISFKLALLDCFVCVYKSNFRKYSVDKCHAIYNWENAKDDKIWEEIVTRENLRSHHCFKQPQVYWSFYYYFAPFK